MITRRIVIGAVATGAAAAAIATASPAFALGTATVTAPGVASGTTINLAGANSGNLVLTDLRNSAPLTCSGASTATGNTKAGSGQSPNAIAKITATAFNSCSAAGVGFTVTQNQTWNVDATVATTSAGVTEGKVSSISATVKVPTQNCKFDVTGAASGRYTNGASGASSTKLELLPLSTTPTTLTISNVTTNPSSGTPTTVASCLGGLIQAGDTASFKGTYTITGSVSGAAKNPVNINVAP